MPPRSWPTLRFWRVLGGNLALTLALLLALEGGSRLLGVHFPSLPTPETPDRALWTRDPRLGWALRPGAEGRIDLGGPDRGLIRVNALGLRGGEITLAKPLGVLRILVCGDSYVMGVGVDEEHLLTTHLRSLLSRSGRLEVVNMGVNGYSTDQQLLQFRDLGVRLQPDLVILIAGDNDFDGIQEDFAYRAYYKPYFELVDGALVARNVPIPELTAGQRAKLWLGQHSTVWNAIRSRSSTFPTAQRFLDSLQVAVPRAPAGDTMELMGRLIIVFRDEVERVGARFVLFNTGHRGERTELFQALRPRLREHGIAFHGLEGHLGEARKRLPAGHWDYQGDAHWNVDAHRLAAEVVANFLEHAGLLNRSSRPANE